LYIRSYLILESQLKRRTQRGYHLDIFFVPVRHFFVCDEKKNLPAIFSMACISSNYFRSFAESFSPVYFESSLFSMLYVVHITVCVLKDVSILFLLSPSLFSRSLSFPPAVCVAPLFSYMFGCNFHTTNPPPKQTNKKINKKLHKNCWFLPFVIEFH